ncbi:hypothetical protein BLNAU_25071 [Blattamonas nauphoetae]|uniref:Uncharacterized protein n=1 Tax=Blattamonas nauphoetae TaxID=2049346 RepID=A0ABQ9WPP0_9EUKA|nr:hypothetical protein BLNAU_25071 [Blattamonas nauphoetae]
MDNKHCLREISVGIGITSSFAGTIEIFSRQSHSIVATLSFSLAATLALPLSGRQSVDFLIVFGTGALFMILFNCEMGFPKLSASLPPHSGSPSLISRPFRRRFGKIGRCRLPIHGRSRTLLHHHPPPPTPLCLSLTSHTLPLPSASPSPPTPSYSPLPLPHHLHPPTPLCLSLTTHTLLLPLPLPHHPPTPSASPSPPTPSHSLCLSLTTHTLPLPLPLPHHPLPPTPSAFPSPPTPSHSPLPLPHHPLPPTPLCLSLTTHTLPLPSAFPSPPTPSHSPLPLPHHPLPPTPLCLSLTTHTLPLPSASPSPPTPSLSPLPLPHHALSCIYWWLFLVVEFFTVLSSLPSSSRIPLQTGSQWKKEEECGRRGEGDGGRKKEEDEKGRESEETQTQSTSRLATSSPQSPRFWLDTHHIVAFAHSLCRYCLVSARAAGVNEIPVDLAVEAAPVDERVIEMKETGLLMSIFEGSDGREQVYRVGTVAGGEEAVDSARAKPGVAIRTDSAFLPDCSAFLNWDGETFPSEDEQAVIFRSLVATVKFKPVLNDSLEAKSVRYLNSVLGRTTDESSTNFVQSIGVLLSTLSRVITTTAMEMLRYLFNHCSLKLRLTFVKADLIPQIINSLHPLSVSFVEAVNIHTCLLTVINQTVWLATQGRLAELKIEDGNEQQAVHETLLHQVLVPSEEYICHLCTNRFSIIDGQQSKYFLELLAQLLRICSYYQPTMEIVLHVPVFLTIPSCLTFFENHRSIWSFLYDMTVSQRDWNQTRGDQRQMWKIVSRMLRMEGMENVIEAKLENDKDMYGRSIVDKSIEWNNLLGMNLPGFGRNRRNKRTIKLVSAFFWKRNTVLCDIRQLWLQSVVPFARRILDLFRSSADPSDTDSEGSEDTVAEFILRFFSLVFEFFPHLSSPPPTPTAFEGWTRFLFAEINRPCPNEQGNVQTDQQNSDTANLVACHVVSAVTTVLADTPHIVAFAHSMHRCCLVTPRTAGDTEVPVDSASVESEIGTGGSEWRVEWR